MGLSVRNLRYVYGDGFGLEGISFDADDGLVLGIIGPNGSGKSTLIQCLVGLRRPAGGTVTVAGRDIRMLSRRERARLIGYVPQSHPPAFPFRVLDVVLMGRSPYLGLFGAPSGRDEDIARRALHELGIAHLAQRPYTQTSGGERRLVLIARALVQHARLLLLDEPTAYLDFGNRQRVMKILFDLARGGAAVVVSLHEPTEALDWTHRALLLQRGSVVAYGRASGVLNDENLSRAYGINIRRAEGPRFIIAEGGRPSGMEERRGQEPAPRPSSATSRTCKAGRTYSLRGEDSSTWAQS